MLWWAKEGRGYTTDLQNAHVNTKEDIDKKDCRETDIPWAKDYIDARIRFVIDVQSVCKHEGVYTPSLVKAGAA